MIFLYKMSCLLTVAMVMLICLTRLLGRRYDVASWRNLFLLGFSLFYGIGGYMTIDFLSPSENAMTMLALLAPTFLIIFMLSNLIGSRATAIDRLPSLNIMPTPSAIFLVIGVTLGLSLLSAATSAIGYFSALATQFKEGLAFTAVGLAAYYAVARRLSPIGLAVLGGTLLAAILIATVGTSGRRGMLGALLCVGWMWWYVWLRYRPISSTFVRGGAVAVAAALLVIVYSGVRMQGEGGATLGNRATQLQQMITNPRIDSRIVRGMLAQDAPSHTMFIIDNYGETFDHLPLHGLHYFVVNPIPRFLYEDKPIGLGLLLKEQRDETANLGPGIIGHGWAEAKFVGVVYYAIFFGLLTAFVDRYLRNRAADPFTVAIFGTSLGNIVAMSRGETSLFLIHATTSAVIAIFVLVGLKVVAGPFMRVGLPIYPKLPDGWSEPDDAEFERDPAAAEAYGAGAYDRDHDHDTGTWGAPARA